MKVLIILFALFLGLSCQNKSEQKKKHFLQKYPWYSAKIKVDNQTIMIATDMDTCYFTEQINDKVVLKKFVVPKAQRDSIFVLVEDAIKNHRESNQDVSCYAGQYVNLMLEAGNSSISCNYSSISDWTQISPTLLSLSKMTFGRIKKDK